MLEMKAMGILRVISESLIMDRIMSEKRIVKESLEQLINFIDRRNSS